MCLSPQKARVVYCIVLLVLEIMHELQRLNDMLKNVTSSEMHDSTSSEIMEAIDGQPSLGMPGPVCNDGVNETCDHDTVDNISDEIASLCQRARN